MKIFLIINEINNKWYVIANSMEEAIEIYKKSKVGIEFDGILSVTYISRDVMIRQGD